MRSRPARHPRRHTRNGARFTIETDRSLERPYAVIDTRTGEQVGARYTHRAHAEELAAEENASVRSRSAPAHAYFPNGSRSERVASIRRYLSDVAHRRVRVRPSGRRRAESNDSAAGLTDAQLVERMLRAEEPAWREFTKRYDKILGSAVGRVVRRSGRFASSDTEADVRAEVYAALLADDMRRLRSWDADRGVKFSTWLHTVASRAALDHLRTRRRRPTEAMEYESGDDDAPRARQYADTSPDASIRAASRAELRRAMAVLDERDREIATLRFVDDLSTKEVAAELGMDPKTVDVRVFRIRKRLAETLTE